MTMVLFEGNFSSRVATVHENPTDPTTNSVIIRGEDFLGDSENVSSLKPMNTPDFIGPRNATNEARPLLEQQSRNLAMVAVMNIGAYGHEYRKVFDSAKDSVDEGILRLGQDSPEMTVDQQIDGFISQTMTDAYKTHDEVVAHLKSEKEQMRVGIDGPDKELQLELNVARDLVKKQAVRILAVREKLVHGGASEEFMREFDYTTKLMTKPDQEAYEFEKKLIPEAEGAPLINTGEIKLFDKFKYVLSASFGRKALRSIGILSPKSGEVMVIRQDEEATI